MSKGTGHGGQATVEEQIDAIGIGKLQILAYVATFCFVIADGMELIVTNLTFRALPHEWGLDVSARGYLISTSMLGFVVGGLLGGYFADLVGRKTMFYVHAIIFLPFTCASGLSSSFYMLLVSRLFVGFSMGIVLPTSVAYMAEVLPTEWRGRLVASLPVVAFMLGEVLVLMVGIYFMDIYGVDCNATACDWWRIMMIAGVVPDLIALFIVTVYLKESPRFLVTQGRVEEAQEVVAYIAEVNDVTYKLDLVGRQTAEVVTDTDVGKRFFEILEPPIRDIMILIFVIWSLLGLPLFGVSYIWPIILEDHFKVGPKEEMWRIALFALVETAGLLLSFLIVDIEWIGRKGTVAIFSLITCTAVCTASFISYDRLETAQIFFLLTKVFAAPPYAIFYVYAAELLPTTHRSQGVSAANAATKLVGGVFLPQVLTAMVAEYGVPNASKYAFIGYIFSSLAVAGAAFYFGRETSGRMMIDACEEPTDDAHIRVHAPESTARPGYESLAG